MSQQNSNLIELNDIDLPLKMARSKGVSLFLSFKLTYEPFSSKTSTTQSLPIETKFVPKVKHKFDRTFQIRLPFSTATWSGVFFKSFAKLRFAPPLTNNFTVSTFSIKQTHILKYKNFKCSKMFHFFFKLLWAAAKCNGESPMNSSGCTKLTFAPWSINSSVALARPIKRNEIEQIFCKRK